MSANVIFVMLFLMIASPVNAQSIVDVAKSQIGLGETCGDNCGKSIRKYTNGDNVAWCASFVSWVLKQSNKLSLGYLRSAKSYWQNGKRVSNPKPGDIICFYRGAPNASTGHVGIVESVYGNTIVTIQGNVGKYPSKVKRITYQINRIPKLLGFIRP